MNEFRKKSLLVTLVETSSVKWSWVSVTPKFDEEIFKRSLQGSLDTFLYFQTKCNPFQLTLHRK